MKAVFQLITSAAALAGLLGGAASHATNLAELPLKASVLAKPNVVFARDDSGSMDWEMVLRTDNGYVWWNGTSTAWDGTNNRPLESSSSENGMSYLFPMGDGTGGQLYGVGSNYGRAIPPIAQMAWTRSNAFNPLYYNTMVTYPAWSPAYVSGSLRSYTDAPTTAAPSHPGPLTGTVRTLNVGTEWNSSNGDFTDNNYAFSVMPGMVLPIGTSVRTTTATSGACDGGGTRQTLTAPMVATDRCLARIPYYPATFWQRTVCPAGDTSCVAAPDCTVIDPTADPSSACVNSPDGVGKLRRYEIKTGNTFPSGRDAAVELQNFANWFTFYRKRKLMLAGAMGRALEPITGMRLGAVPFCGTSGEPCVAPTMWDADSTDNSINRRAAAGNFYLNSLAAQGTPTHTTMNYIADQFNTNTNIVQYACQRNSLFVVTDGFSNTATITPPPWDSLKSASNYGAAAPYQTTTTGSLADLGLRYYTNRLRTDLPANRVPSGNPLLPNGQPKPNPDLNTNLHITTYGITLGARGTLYPTALDPFAADVFATPPTWPTPVADDPTMIDDLWHATVNGRGKMYLATDVESMRLSIQSAFNDILDQEGSQGGIAVSAVNLDRGDSQAYLASYNPAGWVGDLSANPISITSGAVSATETWSAATLLTARDWTTRIIFSSSGGSGNGTGFDFSEAKVGATVNPNTVSFTNQQVVDYLRGSRSGETSGTFRPRTSLIGAVVNAEPVLARDEKMVYLASGDGMLHAFDTVSGKEEWAYAPPETLAALGKSVQRGWVYQTLLDATPAYGRLSNGSKILVGGLGAAGRSYYALNVSSPKNLDAAAAAAQVRWTFPASTDTANKLLMGYTIGKPVVTKTTAGDVVLVTSGVDNAKTIGDGKGRLWMLNAATGAVLKTFRTTVGDPSPLAEAGLSHVAAFREADGTVRYAFGGDLLGNVWKFDLETAGAGEHVATLVAVLKDSGGVNTQPITATPELTTLSGKRIILIGTGRLLDLSDFGSTRRQSFYAIADGPTLSDARTGLVEQVFTRGATPELTANAFNWATNRGWYFDLPAGEQANTDPIVTYGAVGFVTNMNGSSDCTQASYLYLVDIGTGTQVVGSPFVSQLISDNATSSRVITLRVVNGDIIGTTHRSDNTVYQRKLPLGQTINPSKNAWKEIRR